MLLQLVSQSSEEGGNFTYEAVVDSVAAGEEDQTVKNLEDLTLRTMNRGNQRHAAFRFLLQ